MTTLAILLTTYNSEKYLEAQMDSLISQTYKDWRLYIHDDGSSDKTLSIIDRYKQKDSRIHLLYDDTSRGARDSFMWLLEQVESDLYMFCDHDDVWLPSKIEQSIRLMEQQQDRLSVPIIVCTDAKFVDKDLKIRSESFWRERCHRKWMFNNKWYHLYYNNVIGCTMLFNRIARDQALPYPHNTQMHDSWLAASVLWKGGRIIPIDEPLILYRQHGGNTIGAPERPSLIQQVGNSANLWTKTCTQHSASKPLTRIPFILFFFIKVIFLLEEHIRVWWNK